VFSRLRENAAMRRYPVVRLARPRQENEITADQERESRARAQLLHARAVAADHGEDDTPAVLAAPATARARSDKTSHPPRP